MFTFQNMCRTLSMFSKSGWSHGVTLLSSFITKTYLGSLCTGLMRQSESPSWLYLGLTLILFKNQAKSLLSLVSCATKAFEWVKLLKYQKQSLKKFTAFYTLSNMILQWEQLYAWLKIVAKKSSFRFLIYSIFENRTKECSLVMIYLRRRVALKSDVIVLRSRMYRSQVQTNYLIICFLLKSDFAIFRTWFLVRCPRNQACMKIIFLSFGSSYINYNKLILIVVDFYQIWIYIKSYFIIYQFIAKNNMSQNQSSLLGFLQSRSLFGQNLTRKNSKTKSIKSRESPRVESPNPSNYPVSNMQQSNYTQPWVASLRDSLQRTHQMSSSLGSPRVQQNIQQNVQQNVQQTQQTNNNDWNRNQQTKFNNQKQNKYKIPQTSHQFSYKNGLANFQTAHMQSFRCLDNVSNKISIRLTEINQKIDRFNHKIRAWITQQLHFAYQSIITILDNAFKQQEIVIRAYVQKIEQHHSAQILKNKNILEAEYRRVDQLKQHLKGPQWRKATGQILTSDLQSKIDAFIRQTYQEDAREWVPRSYVRQHLKTIEMQVYQLLKLRTFAVV